MAQLSRYIREGQDESMMEEGRETEAAAEETQLPEISISRTSTNGSSKKSSTAATGKRPSLPRVYTNHKFNQHWKPEPRHGETWKRKHEAELAWHIKWDRECFQNGRVLIIDYISQEQTPAADGGKRHIAVAAVEFQNIDELKHFYADPKRVNQAALRVIHVQNARWATEFLLRKFNIDHPSEIVGMETFSKWAQYEKPRQRNGKPFPNGRSWRGQTDPWRNVARTAFGTDYLKPFAAESPSRRHRQRAFANKPIDAKMMQMNAYEDSRRAPYGWDVSVQRVSVYIQRNLGPPGRISPEADVKNPYTFKSHQHIPNGHEPHHKPTNSKEKDPIDEDTYRLPYFDNSNTVLIFETSASLLLPDCLIQPRAEFESRWRRMSFYLRKEDVLNDSRLAAQCTNFILADVFHGLAVVWNDFLSAASDHVALLEEKIYENPADESRAGELWVNQAAWLKVDKVIWIHQDIIREMQGHMRELADADDEENGVEVDWISSTPAEYERLAHMVSEDLVQPTNSLSDLMYKSVGIRDSRQSLQLGLSMWRLSWITFIFLPLTFIVGFFGMNVDIFGGDGAVGLPSIGWYFVGAAALMGIVLVLWYGVKHSLQRSRQTPYQRGLYEALFSRLEEDYPQLWTSGGAVDDVQPAGFWDRMKWRLLKRWFSPENTIDKKLYSSLAPEDAAGELGAWATFKRRMLVRWLGQIKLAQHEEDIALEEGTGMFEHQDYMDTVSIGELAKYSTAAVVAEAEPSAMVPMATCGLRPMSAVPRRQSLVRSSLDRPGSRGSSGIMIEERNLSDSESDAGEGASSRRGGSVEMRRASG